MATNKQKRERLARAEQERHQQEQQSKRQRALRTTLVAVGVVVAVSLAALAYMWLSEDEPVVTPDGVTADGGVLYPAAGDTGGNKAAADAVEVVMYEDPLCPHCREFEHEHGQYLQDAADRGDISLEYRPIAFVSDDSVAPINASACVLDAAGPRAFVEFHDAMFAGDDTDQNLTELAADSGADGSAVTDCIESGRHDGWVDKVTSDASDAGVEATPTIRVDGETVDVDDLDEVESIIEAA